MEEEENSDNEGQPQQPTKMRKIQHGEKPHSEHQMFKQIVTGLVNLGARQRKAPRRFESPE